MHVGLALLTMFPGRVGGSETYVRGLLGAFASGSGPERATILANRHVMAAYGEFDHGAVGLTHVGSYRPGDSDATRYIALQWARRAPRTVARDVPPGLDLIHYPVTIPIPEVRGVPRVVSLMDLQHHEMPHMFSTLERRLRHWAYDESARRADVVLTISEHARGEIVARLGIEPERVDAIPLGVDHALFTPEGEQPTDTPGRYLLYPANMWPHKNHERLLDAFERVRDPDVWLLLTGQTYGNEGLLAGRERVRHLGHVPAERLAALYRGALGMVFPSLFEGFGLPALEAMASGCPVASSERGALGEVAAGAAVAFNPENTDAIAAAIERLLSDEQLREQLRAAGLARAAGFTWEATAARHVAAYERALSSRAGDAGPSAAGTPPRSPTTPAD